MGKMQGTVVLKQMAHTVRIKYKRVSRTSHTKHSILTKLHLQERNFCLNEDLLKSACSMSKVKTDLALTIHGALR